VQPFQAFRGVGAELMRKCILLTMNDLTALRKKKKLALSQAFYPNQAVVS
jgi:hypothetical protein